MVYPPREDSELLKKYVIKYAKGNLLDVGTGSGIQALAAAKKKSVNKVVAVDIDKDVLTKCRKQKKTSYVYSDLFENVKGKYNTITFNAPYLPYDLNEDQKTALTVCGGKHGYEIFERFFADAGEHLVYNGKILIIFSSLTNKDKVESIITQNGFVFKELEKVKCFWETIYCYLIKWDPALSKLVKKGFSETKYFSKGKRGLIFTANYKNKKITVKINNPKSNAFERIKNEGYWLKRLNKHGIGPKLVLVGNDYVAYEFVEGIIIKDLIKKSSTGKIKKALIGVLKQCYLLDTLGISKEEMHHPVKHIIVSNGKAILIDFERTHVTKRPQNVTQFLQYIGQITKKNLKEFGLNYKKNKNINEIIEAIW